jgi:ribosomal protein S18 acetylase RimI-like enzyme
MFSKLWNTFRSRIILRDVSSDEDIEFIIYRCNEESHHGHFSGGFTQSIETQNGLMKQITAAVNNRPFPFEIGNPRSGVFGRIFIIESNKARVGFVLILEDMPRSWGKKIEIYLLSIATQYRGSGLGKRVIKEILLRTMAPEIYARCFSKSTVMIHLLTTFGFQISHVSEFGTKLLTLQR